MYLVLLYDTLYHSRVDSVSAKKFELKISNFVRDVFDSFHRSVHHTTRTDDPTGDGPMQEDIVSSSEIILLVPYKFAMSNPEDIEDGAPETEQAPVAEQAPPVVEKAAPIQNDTDAAVPFPQKRRKPWFLAGLILVIVVGLAVGLGVGLTQKSDSTGGDAAPSLTGDEQVVEPPLEVQQVCQGEYNKELTCEQVCQSASCCDPWLEEEDGCYSDNPEVCDMWRDAGCFNLAVNSEGDDPNDGETTTDNEQGGGYGIPGGSDSVNNEDLDAPTSVVGEICNGEYNEELTCEDVCLPASSCCDPWLEEGGGCYQENQVVCDLWRAAGCFNLAVNMGDPEEP